jgi:hypothetical protein
MAKDHKHRNEMEIGRSPIKSRGEPLSKVMEFNNYLGRTLTVLNDNSLAVHRAIAKAKAKWAELRRILGPKPILTKTFVRFYKGGGRQSNIGDGGPSAAFPPPTDPHQ